jgi:hypothetical protein
VPNDLDLGRVQVDTPLSRAGRFGLFPRVRRRDLGASSCKVSSWRAAFWDDANQGRAAKLVERLKTLLKQVPMHGPGTKGQRQALKKLIGYLEPRLEMMRYREWIEQDLVIASGQVEGAVRHVVGERMDCAGMRWIPGRAEALLHLRCIELNGDWEKFIAWAYQRYQKQLHDRQAVQIRTDQPMELPRAA